MTYPPDGLYAVRMQAQAVEQTGAWPLTRHASGLAAPGGLPAPSALATATAPDKQLSYDAAALIQAGTDYDATLPNSRVNTVVSPSVIFSPVWGSQAQPALSDAAYCIYRFNLGDYAQSGLPQTLALAWYPGSAPADFSTLWIGLANRDADRWDWYEGPADGVLTLAGYAPYTAPGGEALIAVLLLGDTDCALQSLKVGAPELRAMGGVPGLPGEDYSPPPAGGTSLPASVDLSPECSAVGDQGDFGSCTSFATARGAFDYELGQVYAADGWSFSNDNNLSSTKYLYLVTGWEEGYGCGPYEGRITGEVVDYLDREGDSSEANAPYVNVCDADWGQDAEDDAALLGADGYTDISPTGAVGVQRLKQALAVQRKVLVFQTGVDWDFLDLAPGEVWNYSGDGVIGYHAMALVGYDDALQAFKVRNSWSADWASGGYCWIGYQTFLDGASDLQLWAWSLDVDYHAAVAQRFCGGQQDLAPPTNLQASDGTYADKISLSWDQSDGATGYKVYRDAEDNLVATLGAVTTWDDTGAGDYLGHTYWVQATDGSNVSAHSSPDVGFLGQAPVIHTVTPQSGDPGAVVTFDAEVQGSTPLTYAWDFGGGATPNNSNNVSPQVMLGAEGSYAASLTVTNDYGSDLYEFTLSVGDVNTPPVAVLEISPNSGSEGVNVSLDASGSYDPDAGDSITKYEFDFGDGGGWLDAGVMSVVNHTYPNAGSYTLKVRVTDTFSATDTDSQILTVAGPPDTLLTLPAILDREIVPAYLQIFFTEPSIRRDGRLNLNSITGTISPMDQIGYDDRLKTSGFAFPVMMNIENIGGHDVWVPYPKIVVKNAADGAITGLDDPNQITGITIPGIGGREAGRIIVDINMLILNLPPGVPGNSDDEFNYNLYNASAAVIGSGSFSVPQEPWEKSIPTGVDWGINAGSRGDWDLADFNSLCTSHALNGSTMDTPTPDVFWVRLNGNTRLLDWNEYWGADDDVGMDNVKLVLEDMENNTANLDLTPVGIMSFGDYIAIHHFNLNDGGGYYYDWAASFPGDGILAPGYSYTVSLDDPTTAGVDYMFADVLSVIGNNPNFP